MAARRKNPGASGLYLALIAGGALLYVLLRNRGNALPLLSTPPGGSPPPPPPPPPRPTKGCNGLPFMPHGKAEQLQNNLNGFFDRAQIALCKVDGDFGPNTAQLVDFYRSELAPMAESARRRSGAYTVLADASIFYDPIASDTVTFDLYQRGCDLPAFTMRKSLYDKLTSSAFVWSKDDISAAGLTPAVAG
jgi:hypothetical protein